MPSPTVAMLRILKARRHHALQRTTVFDSYEPAYRDILTETRSIGGDPALDELAEWVADRTRSTGRLPPPAAVAARAREICSDRGHAVPENSSLWTEEGRPEAMDEELDRSPPAGR